MRLKRDRWSSPQTRPVYPNGYTLQRHMRQFPVLLGTTDGRTDEHALECHVLVVIQGPYLTNSLITSAIGLNCTPHPISAGIANAGVLAPAVGDAVLQGRGIHLHIL